MRPFSKIYVSFFLTLFFIAFHGLVSAQFATVKTEVTAGDPAVPGSQFDVAVQVDSNTSGLTPIAASFRVFYDATSVSFVGVSPGQLGPVSASN